MSGSDSDDTYCSEIITEHHIMVSGRPKNKTKQKNSISIVRRSARILKKKINFTCNDKIQKKTARKKGKKAILKPKIIKYTCILKDTLSDMNKVVYKHISKKQIITKGNAGILLNNLNKMKQESNFDDDTYQVWEKLVRQFKSITCSEETSYDSHASSPSHKKGVYVSEIITINDSQSSPCSTAPRIQNDIYESISAAQSNDGSTSCDEIISSPLDENSENIIGAINKKQKKVPGNIKKIKSMIPKEHLIKCNSYSAGLKKTHRSTDPTTLHDNIVSNERIECYEQKNITPSIIIIEKSIPSNTVKYQIDSDTLLESQSILIGYQEHFISNSISNKTLSKTDLKIGDILSNKSKHDATLPHKNILTDLKILGSKKFDTTNYNSVEKSTEIRTTLSRIGDIEIVHDSFSESESILIDNDTARIIQSKQLNINETAVTDQECLQDREILSRDISCVIYPTNDLNNKKILIKNTSRNKKNLPESIINKSKSTKQISNCIEMDQTQCSNNNFMGNSQNDDIFLSSENKYDTPQIKITPIATKVNLQLKNSQPSSCILSDSARNNGDILFNKYNNGDRTETVVYKNTEMKIADMETESILNSMNDNYFNKALSSPVEHSQMTTQQLFNNCHTKIDISYNDLHSDRVHNNTSRSLPLSETNDINNYHWLKNIVKFRKIDENELILKDTLPSFYLQTVLKNVPLELDNEFKW